jgi:hypothetical protein
MTVHVQPPFADDLEALPAFYWGAKSPSGKKALRACGLGCYVYSEGGAKIVRQAVGDFPPPILGEGNDRQLGRR